MEPVLWIFLGWAVAGPAIRLMHTGIDVLQAKFLPQPDQEKKEEEEDDGLRPPGYPTTYAEAWNLILEREQELRLIKQQILSAEPHIPKGVMVCDDLIAMAESQRSVKVV